jgi:hypothetical protein
MIAAFDSVTGSLLPWNSNTGGRVGDALEPGGMDFVGDTLFVAAGFRQMGGQWRNGLAAMDAASGATTDWAPVATPNNWSLVYAFAVRAWAGQVLVGGYTELPQGSYSLAEARYLSRFPTTPDQALPVVAIVSPAAAELLTVGTPDAIRWSATDDRAVRSVDLSLSRSGPSGPWEPIAQALANTGQYTWTVTGPAAQAYLRVDARDLDGNVGSAVSAVPFAIASLPTPTLVELVRLEDTSRGVEITWSAAAPGTFASLAPERSTAAAGAGWSAVGGEVVAGSGAYTLLDAAAPATGTLWYRLAGVTRDGVSVVTTARSLSRGEGVVTLEPIAPNPVSASAQVAYVLPRRGDVRISVLDVQGREVAVLATGDREPGRHVCALSTAGLRPGLYFVRLQAGRVVLRRRLVRMR